MAAIIGPAANNSALSATMLAMPVDRQPCLFQFDQQGAPEEATADLPFVALGSGQPLAYPFLAFIRRIFWPDLQPSTKDGIFAALWTVIQACLVAPGGVAEPVEVMVLDRNGARRLGESDLQEQREAISAAENALKNFRSGVSPEGTEQPTPSVPNPR